MELCTLFDNFKLTVMQIYSPQLLTNPLILLQAFSAAMLGKLRLWSRGVSGDVPLDERDTPTAESATWGLDWQSCQNHLL